MKTLVLLMAIAVTAALRGVEENRQGFVEGQFLIRVDGETYQTKEQIHNLIAELETSYKLYVIRSNHLGNVKFLFVKGDYDDVTKVQNHPGVLYVQRNQIHQVAQTQCSSQSANSCWGLDRTDQREALPYSNPTDPSAQYVWGDHLGSSSVVYVVDTGVDVEHVEFSGRAFWGYTAGDIPTDEDIHGHGTHCAGTVGSDSYGVAKSVPLVAVKVMRDSGFGFTDEIIDGVEWVMNDHNARSESLGQMAKSVATKSIGGGTDDAWNDATQALIDSGVVVVAAAMNANSDACFVSPAGIPDVITVGAADVNDVTATFTNWGTCVDLFGPGVDVLSTTPNGGTDVWSGTSMATPHVSGVIARYQDSLDTAPTPQEVSDWLVAQGTHDALTFSDGQHASSPNIILYGPCDL